MTSPLPPPEDTSSDHSVTHRTFVVLWHEMPVSQTRPSHFDLMLEAGPSLRTWELRAPPSASQSVRAIELAPHRLAYLDYEGPVSGDRGWVTRWDRGQLTWIVQTVPVIRVHLAGSKLHGEWQLTFDDANQWWSFGKTRDEDSAMR